MTMPPVTPSNAPSAATSALAKIIAGAPAAPTPVPPTPTDVQFARGVVTALNADGTLQVEINGATTAVTCDRLAHVVVSVDSVVELHLFGTRMVVDGALATSIAGGTFGLVPIGASVPFHGSTVPTNWLLMDGSTFSGTTYPDLMASLGGTTLPDARGRMIAGTGGIGGSNTQPNLPLGSVGGEQNHTMVTGEMPTHSHPASTGTESQAHAHTADTRDDVYQAAPGTGGGNFALGALSSTFRVAEAVTDNETALHVHSVTVSAVGRGTAMNNMTPYLAAQWIIRAL